MENSKENIDNVFAKYRLAWTLEAKIKSLALSIGIDHKIYMHPESEKSSSLKRSSTTLELNDGV